MWGVDAGGSGERCRVWCTMHQSMWKGFGDMSEKCGVHYTGLYSDKGADRPPKIDIAHNCAPLHSATGPCHPMPIYTAGMDMNEGKM